MIISINKKGNCKECTNYREVSLLAFQERCMPSALKKKCREIVESKLKNDLCGFRLGRSTKDKIFTLRQIFEQSWKYAKDVFACFVDLEKAFERFLEINFEKRCRSMTLVGICRWPLSHSTLSLKVVFV